MADARRATTILLLRDAPTGLEVFMVQRHRKSGFLPNAWVFPGGRVDAGDALDGHPAVRGGETVLRQLGLPRDEGMRFLVAGVRETFEESGVWLGEGVLPDESRGPLNRGELSFADLLEEHDATLDLDRLHAWSYWVTPKAEPRRYDTRFLVAEVDGEQGHHDEHETVDSRWISPRALMNSDPTLKSFPMAPPTWWTLRELSAFDRATVAHAAALHRSQRPIEPIMSFGDDGLVLYLPGHPEHELPRHEGLPTRVAFDGKNWVAYDGDTEMAAFSTHTLR